MFPLSCARMHADRSSDKRTQENLQHTQMHLPKLSFAHICTRHSMTCYNIDRLYDYVERSLEELLELNAGASVILGGDFNQLKVSVITERTGLIPLVSVPTGGAKILDMVMTSIPYQYTIKGLASTVKSDHMAVLAVTDMPRDRTKRSKQKFFRRRTPAMHASLLHHLKNFDDSKLATSTDMSVAWDEFYGMVNVWLKQFYPMRVVSVTPREPDYMTPDIKYLLRRKNRLMRRGALEEASALAVKIGRGIVRHNSRELRKSDENACPKDLWECVNSLTHLRKTMAGCKVTADELNQHFAATSTDNSYQQVDLKTTANPNQHVFTDVQIFHVLDHLRPTAEGTDGLPAWFLRLLAPICAGPIARLVNQSLCCSWVPRQWKTTIIHPAPKVTSPQGPSDYRPISVVPILSRVVKRLVVHTYLYPSIIQQPFADSIKD